MGAWMMVQPLALARFKSLEEFSSTGMNKTRCVTRINSLEICNIFVCKIRRERHPIEKLTVGFVHNTLRWQIQSVNLRQTVSFVFESFSREWCWNCSLWNSSCSSTYLHSIVQLASFLLSPYAIELKDEKRNQKTPFGLLRPHPLPVKIKKL